MIETEVVIVGAGAAGLANAALLRKAGIPYVLLESEKQVASRWRKHYDRLHLHTNKGNSILPGMNYPRNVQKYPPKGDVISYMEQYAEQMEIRPHFDQKVQSISSGEEGWITKTQDHSYQSSVVIVATGASNVPRRVQKPGLDTFPGPILHSAEYKNGSPFEGKNVLVVGFGNSACEIAICLHEHGAHPSMSVRGAVNVIPRDILGIPVLQIGIIQGGLPPRLTDTLNRPLIKMLVGNIEKYGLKKLPYGPREQIIHHGRIPLLDIGTMKLIRNGDIRIYGDIREADGNNIVFEEDKHGSFDAIIMATGYESGLNRFMTITEDRMADLRLPIGKRSMLGKDNLYFCGFYISPTGMLREIKIEATKIVKHIAQRS